jgi:hypothetical protein
MAAVDQENAHHAQAQAAVTKAVVIAALRHAGDRVTRHIQRLADDQLDHVAGVFGGRTLTVAQVIDVVVIGHTVEHLASLRASLDVR